MSDVVANGQNIPVEEREDDITERRRRRRNSERTRKSQEYHFTSKVKKEVHRADKRGGSIHNKFENERSSRDHRSRASQ